MKNRRMQYTLNIGLLNLHLSSKSEYISLLKQMRGDRHTMHLCLVSFDLGNWIVIRSVFKVVNPFTKEKINVELGFRKLREDR